MKICLEDGTIYYEEGVVIKHGMTSDEVLKQLGKFVTNPEKSCIAGMAWFHPLPNTFEGLYMKVDVFNTPVNYVQFSAPPIKGIPKSKEKQTEHLKNVIGEEIFDLLSANDNLCEFPWGRIRLSWDGRDCEMKLIIRYK